jgi:hypothetical protein
MELDGIIVKYYGKILLDWHVNKLRGSSQSEIVPVKDRSGATISDKERETGQTF